MISGVSDLEFTMQFEILPRIELTDLKAIEVKKEVAQPDPDDVAKAVERLVKGNLSYEPKEGVAEAGDRLTIDYKGAADGEPFEGGTAEDAFVVLGSNRFIPGFEDGLKGASAGESRDVTVTFPEDYQVKQLAGKNAVFAVTVKEVASPVEPEANDDFANSLGLDSMAKLEEAIRAQLQRELDNATRAKLKKSLLDALDERHSFEMPPSLVDAEFKGIWANVTRQLERGNSTFEAEGTTEEKARQDYQSMAERRVRLGLVLSEIGTRNGIKITDEEIRRAVMERARQFPGQERQVIEFYRKNPNAMNELRAPVYEDKVIDFALELVKVAEKTVTPAELMAFAEAQQREQSMLEGEGEQGGGHHHDHHDHHDHDAHSHGHAHDDHDHDHEHEHEHEHGGHDHDCGPDCGHDHHHGHKH
jgi:trigger factor